MRQPLRVATFLAPNMLPFYRAIAEYLGQRLGVLVELREGRSFDEFAQGELDAGFICGLPYVVLRRKPEPPVEPLAAPVLRGSRYGSRPIYFSDVIVRRDAPWHSFAELRGRSWAYNDRDSHSGYNITRYTLLRMGETRGFFGRVVAAGFHQTAIRLVADGEVDASAIDSQVLAVELREHPRLAEQVRVVDTLGPATIQPVVAASGLPAALKDDLRAALVALDSEPEPRAALEYGLVERFVPIADADYDDIRAMLAVAEATGFLTLR
jgi:phosphate/phosphite/phosphonate ABC transporter binding protein